MNEEKALAELLALPAGAELDSAVANALGDDLKVRGDAEQWQGFSSLFSVIEPACGAWREFRIVGCEEVFTAPYTDVGLSEDSRKASLFRKREVNGVRKPYADALEAAVAAYRRPAPPYSQDTSEGWWAMRGLMEALKKRGFNASLSGAICVDNHHFGNERRGDEPSCLFWHETTEENRRFFAKAETLPLAVCRAALAALMQNPV